MCVYLTKSSSTIGGSQSLASGSLTSCCNILTPLSRSPSHAPAKSLITDDFCFPWEIRETMCVHIHRYIYDVGIYIKKNKIMCSNLYIDLAYVRPQHIFSGTVYIKNKTNKSFNTMMFIYYYFLNPALKNWKCNDHWSTKYQIALNFNLQ